jgi:3-oxoacyl-[acyl-carrier protein] reductase
MDINLWGTFVIGKVFAAHMVQAGSGRIVLTASNAARAGSTTSSPAYAASKGGVIALTRTMARQLGPHGVTVNAISPGFTMTDMAFAWSDELIADMSRRTPLGRLAQPEDVARAAVALSTDLMGFVTGHVLDVNGGFRFD